MKMLEIVLFLASIGTAVAVVAAAHTADTETSDERAQRRIQMIKNLYPAEWPYLGHCLHPHKPKGLLNFDLRQCGESETPPFEKGSRIAVVGAGPAGISMTKLLSDRGFTDITVFEKEDRVGGKSKHILLESGEKLDVGTIYAAGKYECIELWADQVGMTEKPVDPDGATPRLISAPPSLLADMSPPNFGSGQVWSADYAFRTYGVAPETYSEQLVSDLKKYFESWTQSMGSFEYMFPDEATVNFESINQSFLSWLEKQELYALIPRLIITTSAQGYGNLNSIPAFYGLMWNHPNLLTPGRHACMFEDWQTMWERLLDTTDATIHLEAEITWIKRRTKSRHHNRSPVEIQYRKRNGGKKGKKKGEKKVETFDFVIMAAPMPGALDLLHKPTTEELELFSEYNYKTVRYDAGYLVNTGVVPDAFNLFSWAERIDKQTDYHVTSRISAHKGSDDGLDRYSLVRDGIDGAMTLVRLGRIKGVSESTLAFSVSPFDSSVEAIRELLIKDLDSYEMEMEFVHTEIWKDYLPWKNLTQIVQDRMPWRIWENQGNEDTWFIGNYASFESVADVLDYNIKMVNEQLCVSETLEK